MELFDFFEKMKPLDRWKRHWAESAILAEFALHTGVNLPPDSPFARIVRFRHDQIRYCASLGLLRYRPLYHAS
jgi:hypothetical protein